MKWMTLKDIAKQHGLSYEAMQYRVRVKKLSREEAVARPFVPQIKGPGSVKHDARAAGKSETTVRRAMARGLTLPEALAYVPQPVGLKVKL